MRLLIILAIVSFILHSCNTTKKVEHYNGTDECMSMTYNSKPVNNLSTDYYNIDTVFITKNCLNIWVSYGGGCGEADFKLYYSDKISMSYPPKTSLRLQLSDNDPCRAIIQQKLLFNLSFFDEYAENEGITLKLAGTDRLVFYKH